MIERLQAIATFLSRFTLLISLLALFFVGLFLTSLFEVGGMTTDDANTGHRGVLLVSHTFKLC